LFQVKHQQSRKGEETTYFEHSGRCWVCACCWVTLFLSSWTVVHFLDCCSALYCGVIYVLGGDEVSCSLKSHCLLFILVKRQTCVYLAQFGLKEKDPAADGKRVERVRDEQELEATRAVSLTIWRDSIVFGTLFGYALSWLALRFL
jgi:hypothetical protein